MTIGPFHTNDPINDHLRAEHIASREPRYSVQTDRLNGGYVRQWTNDRQTALRLHGEAIGEPQMKAVFCYDHIAIDRLATHVRDHGRSYEQITQECEAMIDAMNDRWRAAG
jgi:hypothetical protein